MKHILSLILACCVLWAQSDSGFPQLYEKAKSGDPTSQNKLGVIYQNGLNGQRVDVEQSAKWFLVAAEQGLAEAQANFGNMCATGLGVERNYERGFFWTELSAKQGHAYGMGQLGYYYFSGQGVSKDYVQAYKWLVLAAAQGDGTGEVFLEKLKPLISLEELREGQLLAAGFKPKRYLSSSDLILKNIDGVKPMAQKSAVRTSDEEYVIFFIGILVMTLLVFGSLESRGTKANISLNTNDEFAEQDSPSAGQHKAPSFLQFWLLTSVAVYIFGAVLAYWSGGLDGMAQGAAVGLLKAPVQGFILGLIIWLIKK
jgi:Sel1 repeat